MPTPLTMHLARYRFSFRVTEDLWLPAYAGSALRGVFGHALMQLSGLQKRDIAERNPLYQYSPYAAVFEPDSISSAGIAAKLGDTPVPYIIEAPTGQDRHYQEGKLFSFDMVLIGSALEHLAIIILAWRRAMLRGIGKNNQGKAELTQVQCRTDQDKVIYSEYCPLVQSHHTCLEAPLYTQASDVSITISTPLRLQQQGKILNSREFTPAIFLKHLLRRVLIYLQQQQPELHTHNMAIELNTLTEQVQGIHRLKPQKWQRYSNRQRQQINLDGLVGTVELQQVPAELLPYLYFGQFLHLGKNTSFGLGNYQLEASQAYEKQSLTI